MDEDDYEEYYTNKEDEEMSNMQLAAREWLGKTVRVIKRPDHLSDSRNDYPPVGHVGKIIKRDTEMYGFYISGYPQGYFSYYMFTTLIDIFHDWFELETEYATPTDGWEFEL